MVACHAAGWLWQRLRSHGCSFADSGRATQSHQLAFDTRVTMLDTCVESSKSRGMAFWTRESTFWTRVLTFDSRDIGPNT